MISRAKKRFAKCENGLIHLINVLSGGEFTLCGDAFEGHALEGPDFAWEECDKRPVTCPRCAAEIENCRGVRISKKPPTVEYLYATETKSCDLCRHQEEGRHYCLLHSVTVKNMDAYRCRDFAKRITTPNEPTKRTQ